MRTAGKQVFALSTALVSCITLFANAPSAFGQNQSKLDQAIQTESNALGGLAKDLGGDIGTLSNIARQFGDPNLPKEFQQLRGSAASGMGGGSTNNQISGLASQVAHIPGFEGICQALQSFSPNGTAAKQFTKPGVASSLLPQYRNAGTMGGAGSLKDLALLSGMNSPAAQSEMSQAAQVLPSAVSNMEQENAAINQLLKE